MANGPKAKRDITSEELEAEREWYRGTDVMEESEAEYSQYE